MQELRIYWRIIRKRLWLIGLLIGATIGTILLVSYLAKPLYRASTSFEVIAPLPAGVSLFSEYKTPSTREEIVRTSNTFLAVLHSDFVLGQVAQELDLDTDARGLRDQVLVEPDENGTFTLLRVTAEDPVLAAAIANTLMQKALEYFGEVGASSLTANKTFIQVQLGEAQDELEKAREALIQFQIENRLSFLEELLKSQQSLITTLKLSRDKALAEGHEELVAGYEQVTAARERELQGLILLNAEYELLRDELIRTQANYSALLAKESEAELKENEVLSATFVQVIPAREPSRPLPRVNPKVVLLGGIVSLVLGVMIAFFLHSVEPADVETDRDSIARDTIADAAHRDVGPSSVRYPHASHPTPGAASTQSIGRVGVDDVRLQHPAG